MLSAILQDPKIHTSSSGTPNFFNKALALLSDKRLKSASVPVTVLLGCDSCSSLFCYKKRKL